MPKNTIKSNTEDVKVLGIFEGVAANATITNRNGLDITRPVWEGVFASEDYRTGIDNGWFLGFLSHPKEGDDQEFRHACIKMVEGHIDGKGMVHGKFELLPTPVGLIVKTLIDCGVIFGISVRGVGDIHNNSVDPDTFIFRGFDLVIFPAYEEAVPTFSKIAASTDAKTRNAYKQAQVAIKNNLQEITCSTTLEQLQSQFAAQSEEFTSIEARLQILQSKDIAEMDRQRVQAMVELYHNAIVANYQLTNELEQLRKSIVANEVAATKRLDKVEAVSNRQTSRLVKQNQQLVIANKNLLEQHKTDQKDIKVLGSVKANSEEFNLKYNRAIEAHQIDLDEKDEIIANLEGELSETVAEIQELELTLSNRDDGNRRQIEASERLLRDYQLAYAKLYATATGGDANITITSSTTVGDMKSMIAGGNATLTRVMTQPRTIDLDEFELESPEGNKGIICT